MSNEYHLEIIKERKEAYPDRSDRPPEVSERLEALKLMIGHSIEDKDSTVRFGALILNTIPDARSSIGEIARESQLAYRILQEYLLLLRIDEKLDDRKLINNLPDSVIAWILEVATGQCVEPKSVGRSRSTNLLRDRFIAISVILVHDNMDLPYESDEKYSACHEVADYMDMKYGSVRTIWRKSRDLKRSPAIQYSLPKHLFEQTDNSPSAP
ncbi:MAG: hypothetical protein F4Z81_00680 [Gemmatimonadetes bacterium]|nr:hypothetical protein [Gemmatimonadota bacterium]MYB61906.1 hypothetical protein [Gemmatimonadota bacterium]